MLAHFSLWPMDNPHLSKDLQRVYQTLDDLDVTYEVSVMGTTISGEWDEVCQALKACHEVMAEQHQRVLINVMIDDDRSRDQSLEAAQERLDRCLPS